MNGLILVDKPGGCTSHDVVNRWRRLAHTKRTGHLGTLDPMATGLLALVTGTATRLAQFFRMESKTYEARVTLGKTSDTLDADGTITEVTRNLPEEQRVLDALSAFQGTIWQTPPVVSAKKIGGVRAYVLARRSEPVELAPVQITIERLEITRWEAPDLDVVVTCSAGTYIRSIARDIGCKLGCGALLGSLRRTHIGDFDVRTAYTLEALQELASLGRLQDAVTPAGLLLPHMPAHYVDFATEAQIRHGRDFRTSPFVVAPGAAHVKALSHSGELIAIGELRIPNVYHPMTVL